MIDHVGHFNRCWSVILISTIDLIQDNNVMIVKAITDQSRTFQSLGITDGK